MLLVDSSVWINYFNGAVTPQTDYLHSILGRQVIVMGDLILTEVLQGFQQPKAFQTAQQTLIKFPLQQMVGVANAMQSANNYRFLRTRGVTVRKTMDCLIATFCIESGHSLLHQDRDLDPFEQYLGLRVIHP